MRSEIRLETLIESSRTVSRACGRWYVAVGDVVRSIREPKCDVSSHTKVASVSLGVREAMRASRCKDVHGSAHSLHASTSRGFSRMPRSTVERYSTSGQEIFDGCCMIFASSSIEARVKQDTNVRL